MGKVLEFLYTFYDEVVDGIILAKVNKKILELEESFRSLYKQVDDVRCFGEALEKQVIGLTEGGFWNGLKRYLFGKTEKKTEGTEEKKTED
ncbi:unnamed protein product [Arabis nemorensis]|uniref:Uncharacterized protein n=1 Tax=Arabis nemorensis TaxID=586526 RepID=A0A565BA21_9BRAS|nr:unnamed protein product [Arabis nemorensis]